MSEAHRMQDLERCLADLPILPTLVGRLVTLDMNAEGSFDEVVAIAEEEPTFAIRILALANSVLFAPNQEITSIREAVSRVGAWRIAELCSSMALLRVFAPSTDDERGLWLHSIQVAVGARQIAGAISASGVEPQEAYLVGLLHDFGRFVLLEFARLDLQRIDEVGFSHPELLVALEKLALGFDHAEAGARALEHWGLPASLAAYVRNHHIYGPASGKVDNELLLQVVQVADHLSVLMQLDPEGFHGANRVDVGEVTKCTRAVHPDFSLSPDKLAELAPAIRAEAEALALGLGI
jgi:HD-like signal output (HDOD) protein